MNAIRRLTAMPFLALFSFLLFSNNSQSQIPNIYAQVGYPVGTSSNATAYGNSIYLVQGGYTSGSNKYYSSSNATNWNIVTTTGQTTKQMNFMVFGANLFVAVGNDGTIQTSPNGATWTTRTSGTSNHLHKVYFLNSKFFAIGLNRTLLTSTDGITWTAVTFNVGVSTDMFMSLSYGNGAYIIGSRNSGGSYAYAYRSTTAANNSWTVVGYATFNYESVNRIEFLKDKFWMFTIGQVMYTSSDGITWSNITPSVVVTNPDLTTASFGNGNQIFNAIYDGTRYYFYGCSAYFAGYGSTFVSTNGTAWTLLAKTAYIVPQESEIVNGVYFVNGNEGFVTSSDGNTYAHSGASFADVVKTATKYVSGGYMGNDGVLYNSTDFYNWTSRGTMTNAAIYAMASDGTNVLAAGSLKVFKSTNSGDTWTNVYTTNNGENFYSMAYGNGKFVANGYDNSTAFIRYSTDNGTSWTTASTDAVTLYRIKYLNGWFIGLGVNNNSWEGVIMVSSNGIAWTDATPVTAYTVGYYKDVVYDGSKYHVLGVEFEYDEGLGYNYTKQFFTLSTTTPQTAASYTNKAVCTNIPVGAKLGGDYDQGALNYDGSRFIGGVMDMTTGRDYLIYSADGTSWTCVEQPGYSAPVSSVVDNSKVRILGRANGFYTGSYSILPVSWSSFTAQWYQDQALLKWTSKSEQNTDRYEVEFSKDGRSFERIETIKAKGNSAVSSDYQYAFTPSGSKIYYFRIKQVDVNGQYSYSAVTSLQAIKSGIARIFPNPSTDGKIHLQLTQNSNVVLISPQGAVLFNGPLSAGPQDIDVTGKPKGVYMLRAGTEVLRVVVR